MNTLHETFMTKTHIILQIDRVLSVDEMAVLADVSKANPEALAAA